MSHILVLGASDIFTRRVLPALEKCESCVAVDVASLTKDMEKFKKSKKVCQIFHNYYDALGCSKATWVYVSNRNIDHFKTAFLALESGKNVVIDKPAALNLVDAKYLIKKASELNLRIVEASVFTFHSQFNSLKNIISGQKISRILSIFSVPKLEKNNFRMEQNIGGGSINDLGAYVFGLGRFVWGMEPMKIEVFAHNSGDKITHSFSVLFDYGDSRRLIGHFGFDTCYVNKALIFGDRKAIEFDRVFTTTNELENIINITENGQAYEFKVEASDPFERFFSAIFTNTLDFDKEVKFLLNNVKGIEILQNKINP